MRTLFIALLLTLVLLPTFGYSAPHDYVNEEKNNDMRDEPPNPEKIEEESLSVSVPKQPIGSIIEAKKSHYPYLQSISPRIGALIDPIELNSQSNIPTIYGVHYLAPKFQSPQLEVSIDLVTDSTGHFSGALRWTMNERSSFRFFYKAGGNLKIISYEQLAGITKIGNYFARGAIGIEDLISHPMSIRIELELLTNISQSWIILSAGYSWGW